MHAERSDAINNKIPSHPSVSPMLFIMKLHLIHAPRAFGSLRTFLQQPNPKKMGKKKKGQRKLKGHQSRNFIHSHMIYFPCSYAGTTPGMFMRWTGTWERMVTTGSGRLFVKIINGLKKGTLLLGLMICGVDGKSKSERCAAFAHRGCFPEG